MTGSGSPSPTGRWKLMDTVTLAPRAVCRAVDTPSSPPGTASPTARSGALRPPRLAPPLGRGRRRPTRGSHSVARPRLAGVLPVIVDRRHLRTPADWHTPWIEAIAEDPEALRALATGLAATRLPRIIVDFVLAGEATAEASAVWLQAAGYRLSPRLRLASPSSPCRAPGRTTWGCSRPIGGASSGAAPAARGGRSGDPGGPRRERGTAGLLDEAFAVEAAGWKGRRGTAIASDPAVEQASTAGSPLGERNAAGCDWPLSASMADCWPSTWPWRPPAATTC